MTTSIATMAALCTATMLLAGGLDSPVHAQMAPACDDFAERAIRLEPGGWLKSSKLVRGPAGVEAVKLGYRTAKLEALMQVSDSAVAYAIDYGRSARRGTALMGLAFVTSVATPLLVDFENGRNDGIKWTSYGVSFALGLLGSASQRQATRSLSRAIWHYNVTIQQDAPPACVTNAAAAAR